MGVSIDWPVMAAMRPMSSLAATMVSDDRHDRAGGVP
jgi:hypothetical protein